MCFFFVPASGSLYIQNASGIQIGSHNTISFRSTDSAHSSLSQAANSSALARIEEGILKYGNTTTLWCHYRSNVMSIRN